MPTEISFHCKISCLMLRLSNYRTLTPGAHNYIRAEGKGGGMQRSHERLNFELFHCSLVTILLFLARMLTCTNTHTETSQWMRKRKAGTK